MRRQPLTEKQKLILSFIGDKEVTKREIVKEFQHWNFRNASKHIGDKLSRLVKMGVLERPRIGVYRWTGRTEKAKYKEILDKNQGELF